MIYELDGARPTLPAGFSFIADTATVIGNVEIGAEASIWFGSVLRGDGERITIGPSSNVQDNCILHTDDGLPLNVGAECTIGHGVILHGCTIGDQTLIGMGACILNGAVIGRNCLVGAGTLVTEGRVIPDGSLVVGSPGRVIRQLDAEAIARIARSAEDYAVNAKRFATGCRIVHQGHHPRQ